MKIVDLRGQLPVHKRKEYKTRNTNRIRSIAIHHSATKEGGAFSFANYHVNTNNWPGIGYHYVILPAGTIEWCHDLDVISYHVGDSNGHAVGICLVGNFINGVKPTQAQMEALFELCNHLREHLSLEINEFKGHNEFPGYSWKNCPGFDMDKFRSDLKMYEKTDMARVAYNGKVYYGKLIDGLTYVPLREFAQDLGMKVNYVGPEKPIYVEGESPDYLKKKLKEINKLSEI